MLKGWKIIPWSFNSLFPPTVIETIYQSLDLSFHRYYRGSEFLFDTIQSKYKTYETIIKCLKQRQSRDYFVFIFQEHLDTSELSDLMTDSTSSPMSSIDSNFQTPNTSSSHTNVIIPRGARRLSGKQSTNSSHQPHSVDSGIGSPRSIPLYSPTTPITPKTSSSPSVSFSENSPEK